MLEHKTARFLVAGLLLLGALWLVGNQQQRVPPLPVDRDHRQAQGNTACAPCHGPDAPHPLAPGHPPKDDCIFCHEPGS